MDVIDGLPMGSVRISFGFSSTLEDCHTFLRFVRECFVDSTNEIRVEVAPADSTVGTRCTDDCQSPATSVVPVRVSDQVKR